MLLTPEDLGQSLNIDLTSPNGAIVAQEQLDAAVALAESIVGYKLEQSVQTAYFHGESRHLFLPTAAPVTAVTIATLDYDFGYDDVDAEWIRHVPPSSEVFVVATLRSGFQTVKATFTAGWTAQTLPADLRNALISLAGLRLKAINNESADEGEDTGALKKVSSGTYTEEYAVTAGRKIGDQIPDDVMAVFQRYRRAWAW
jgi:hypothetical protein